MNESSTFMNEVLNYFTLHKLLGFSDKKTLPAFESLRLKGIDVQREMPHIVKETSSILSLDESLLLETYKGVKKDFDKLEATDKIIKKGMVEYPNLLAQTNEAPPYLFLRGNIDLLNERIVSIVGSRDASQKGQDDAYRLADLLGRNGIVVASGLAKGIDTSAHKGALENGHLTISVIGTPLTRFYPKENEYLQKEISQKGLVLSQFPPSSPTKRWHFPRRNAVMSGISLATTIVEAGEKSGALIQADYAIKQGRMIFIPESVAKNENLSWPEKYLKGEQAYTFSKVQELLGLLQDKKGPPKESQLSLF